MTRIDKDCPLCGKQIEGDDVLCNDCRNSADNQYQSDFIAENHSDQSDDQLSDNINSTLFTKKKRPTGIIVFVIVCILVTVFGIVASLNVSHLRQDHIAEDRYWEQCLSTNSVLSYSKYLVAYPDGKYVELANNNIQKLKDNFSAEWSELRKEGNINDILLYIKNNPDSEYIDSAKYIADSISWINALNLNNLEAISTYISSVELGVVSGFYKELAQDRYDYLSSIKQLDSIALHSVQELVTSFYVYLRANDTVSMKKYLPEVILLNNDSIDRSTILSSFLKRQYDKDSLIIYTPDLNSFEATIDRDSSIFLSYVEDKSVVPRQTKTKKKKITQIKNIIYKDSVSMIIKKPKQIVNILFKNID